MSTNVPLVSIITPCYNGEKVVSKLIESVLFQTYPNIEFIIVNDGSTDRSEEIILSYEQSFVEKGYKFKYIKQDNKGLGGAINTGLKHFTGEFLCWPDSDDYLELNSIEVKVNFLIENPQYGVVTSNAYIRKHGNLTSYKKLVSTEETYVYNENQFDYLLNGRGPFCSGCHMLRTEMFLQVNPERSIFEARRGQNWQLLLPMYYKYKRAFIDIPLYNYIEYSNSMSRDKTYEEYITRLVEHEEIIIKTLEMIEDIQKVDLSDKKEYIKEKYIHEKLILSADANDRELFFEQYKIKKKYGITNYEKYIYFKMKLMSRFRTTYKKAL